MSTAKNCPFFAYWIAFAACLGGFLQSYAACIIAGSLLFISEEFSLTPMQEGNIASLILVGALIGALSSSHLADRLGRRPSLFISAILYLATGCASLFISSYFSLVVLRLVTGFAVGMTSLLVPIYLAEIAPPAKRGAFVTAFQLSVTIGTLAAYFINLLFSDSQDWRMMFFAASFPAGLQVISLFFFPESPKWLIGQGRLAQARKFALKIQGETSLESPHIETAKESLFSRPFWLLILIGVGLAAFQQFCGINAVVYFTPKIFREAGFASQRTAIAATLLMGVVNVISTLLTIFLIDRVGRRKLLLFSQAGVVLTLAILTLSFATHSPFIDSIAAAGVIFYIFLYSIGLGPIVWVLISEIFPLSVRAKALALTTVVSWSSNYIVVLSFPSLSATFGPAWTFSLYGILSFIALLFFLRFIPETKGKSLEELEQRLVHRPNNKNKEPH